MERNHSADMFHNESKVTENALFAKCIVYTIADRVSHVEKHVYKKSTDLTKVGLLKKEQQQKSGIYKKRDQMFTLYRTTLTSSGHLGDPQHSS